MSKLVRKARRRGHPTFTSDKDVTLPAGFSSFRDAPISELVKKKEARSDSCGSCTLCCKLLGVKELSKPADTWCDFCNKSGGGPGGCTIYANRPDSCKEFQCGYLINGLPEEYRPDRVKMVITGTSKEIEAHILHVDPNYPGAYREGNGKRLIEALLAASSYRNVVLCIGNKRRFFGNNPEKIMARIAQLEREGKIAL